MFDRCKGTANPPNRQILIEFFMQKNLPGGHLPGLPGDRYLAATTERQWLPGTCPLAGVPVPWQDYRRIAMIGFYKFHHLLISCKPTCLLIHNFCVSPHQSFFRGILGKFFKSQIPCNPPILWEFQTFSELIYGEKHDFYGEFTNQCFRGYLQYNT